MSLRLVEHKITQGGSYSIMVNAYADCVLWITSNPSCFSASLTRRAKKTLESMSRMRAGAETEELIGPPVEQRVLPDPGLPQFHSPATGLPLRTQASFRRAAEVECWPIRTRR